MISPAYPFNENARLKELLSLEILDTEPETEYDQITEFASQVCGAPISLISLIDSDRQYFKSAYGIKVKETPRHLSFCAHAINHPNQIFEVANARIDDRFHDHPMVVGQPNIIYYAGMPIVSSQGHALGTLCVVDYKPNELNEFQKNSLKILSTQVMKSLDLRRYEMEINLQKEKMKMRKVILSELNHILSYDLHSPINKIIGLSEVLTDSESPSPELTKKISNLINLSACKLKVMMEEVLTCATSENFPGENQ